MSSALDEYKVLIEEPAQQDLRDIYKYIAETLTEPQIAARLVGSIREEIESLDRMPERFPLYDSQPWRSRDIRRLNVGNFAAFYVVVKDNRTVSVLAVMYSGRNIDEILIKKLNLNVY